MGPKRKRQRTAAETQEVSLALADLLGRSTQEGLQEILRVVSANPEALDAKRRDMYRASRDLLSGVKMTLEMPTLKGPAFNWVFLHPGRLVTKLTEESSEISEIFATAFNKKKPTFNDPWTLVVGFDEFVPGNKLAVDNRRKTMVLSFTFLELDMLSHEDAWFTPIAVRANMIGNCVHGWSGMLRQFLRIALIGPGGFSTSGVALNLNGQPAVLFAKLKHMIADGDGLRQALDWKGANAIKVCFRHWNCVSKRAGRDLEDDEEVVDVSCTDYRLFRTAGPQYAGETMDLVLAAQRRRQAGQMAPGRLQQITTAAGMNPNIGGVLADIDLRREFCLTDVATIDWFHTMLQDAGAETTRKPTYKTFRVTFKIRKTIINNFILENQKTKI